MLSVSRCHNRGTIGVDLLRMLREDMRILQGGGTPWRPLLRYGGSQQLSERLADEARLATMPLMPSYGGEIRRLLPYHLHLQGAVLLSVCGTMEGVRLPTIRSATGAPVVYLPELWNAEFLMTYSRHRSN